METGARAALEVAMAANRAVTQAGKVRYFAIQIHMHRLMRDTGGYQQQSNGYGQQGGGGGW